MGEKNLIWRYYMEEKKEKIINIRHVGRMMVRKIVVSVLAMVLIFTTYSAANIQNQESLMFLKNPGRGIIWDVVMNFNNSGGLGDYVTFGEAPDANDGPPVDAYDVMKPPAGMTPYIRTWLNDNLPIPYDALFADYRHYPGTSKVWNLTVHWMPSSGSSPTTITMSWLASEVDDSEYTSVNLCTETGTILKNMLIYNTYIFSCPAYVPQNFKIICSVNQPPVFGTPTPANSSTNQPLSLTWGIPINDPEGNTFNWWIQCSNGQTNSGSGVTNGTKTLVLSGLAYATTYKVWVNATDPTGSGLYTRRWYRFTTLAQNFPPVFGTPTPVNGSTGQPLSLTWGIPINDPEGNSFNWWIQCSNGQTNTASGASNGTKNLVLSGLAYSTTYKIWVNATDPTGSGLYTRRWYTFTTKANLPPVFGTPSPANGSTSQPLSLTWGIPINDPEGNSFNWWIQCSNGQTNSGTAATNGTKSLTLSGLAYATTYKVWVNATDPTGSNTYTRRWYTFRTQAQNLPPVFGTPTPVNGSTGQPLSLTWGILIIDPDGNLFSWTIQCSNGQTNSGTAATNGTKSLALSGLAYATTYKVWVNATDPTGSGLYTRRWYGFITLGEPNSPPATPQRPSGEPSGQINVEYTYTTITTDPNSDQIYYNWSWGDSTTSGWLGPYPSNQTVQANHTWMTKGSYAIKVKAKDSHGAESNWSEPFDITMTTELSVKIKGGLGVKMVITNDGTSAVTGVVWQIHVKGGILGVINKTKSGTIDIPAGASKTVSTGLIPGLGSVTISTQVDGSEKKAQGFVLFFVILGVKEITSLNNSFGR